MNPKHTVVMSSREVVEQSLAQCRAHRPLNGHEREMRMVNIRQLEAYLAEAKASEDDPAEVDR